MCNDKNYNLYQFSEHAIEDEDEKRSSKTVVRKLLEEVVNGHKLVLKELDEYLEEDPKGGSLNAKNYAVKINLQGILPVKEKNVAKRLKSEEKIVKQCQVLFDIFDVGVDSNTIEDIVKHPVITAMILKKWQRTRKFYYLTTLVYLLFLLSYSILIYDLFGPLHKNERSTSDRKAFYLNTTCPDKLANDTSDCQYRDPICSTGKYTPNMFCFKVKIYLKLFRVGLDLEPLVNTDVYICYFPHVF